MLPNNGAATGKAAITRKCAGAGPNGPQFRRLPSRLCLGKSISATAVKDRVCCCLRSRPSGSGLRPMQARVDYRCNTCLISRINSHLQCPDFLPICVLESRTGIFASRIRRELRESLETMWRNSRWIAAIARRIGNVSASPASCGKISQELNESRQKYIISFRPAVHFHSPVRKFGVLAIA